MATFQVRQTETTPGEQREFAALLAAHFDNLTSIDLDPNVIADALSNAGLGLFEVVELP